MIWPDQGSYGNQSSLQASPDLLHLQGAWNSSFFAFLTLLLNGNWYNMCQVLLGFKTTSHQHKHKHWWYKPSGGNLGVWFCPRTFQHVDRRTPEIETTPCRRLIFRHNYVFLTARHCSVFPAQMAQDSLQRAGQVCDPLRGLSEGGDPGSAARGQRCRQHRGRHCIRNTAAGRRRIRGTTLSKCRSSWKRRIKCLLSDILHCVSFIFPQVQLDCWCE